MKTIIPLLFAAAITAHSASIEKTFIWEWEFTANGGTIPGATVGGTIEAVIVPPTDNIERTLFDFQLLIEHEGDLVSFLNASRHRYGFRPVRFIDVWYVIPANENTLANRRPLSPPSRELAKILDLPYPDNIERALYTPRSSTAFSWSVDHCDGIANFYSLKNDATRTNLGRLLTIDLNNFRPLDDGWSRCAVFGFDNDRPIHLTFEESLSLSGSFKIQKDQGFCDQPEPKIVSIQVNENGIATIHYEGTLQEAAEARGPYKTVIQSRSPFQVAIKEMAQRFFRAK